MEIRQLATFIRVAQFNSFSRAAESLGYSQSAVTVQIRQLEEELDTRLFDRMGKRLALPNAEVMIHQPSAGTQGKVTDMEIDVEHFLKIKQRINKILADNTGKTPEQIKSDSERDNWMTAEEAKEYGLIDKVIYKR